MQYNADTLSTKIAELKDRLVSDDIDVCLIQETKLLSSQTLPSFEDIKYHPIRQDRNLVNAGGGLLILLKKTLVFEGLNPVAIEGTETLSVKVRLDKNNWIYITNIYTPPPHTIGQDVINLWTDIIPAFKSSLICGDFNGHHALWDEIQPPDDRGEQVVDWILDKELTILNDGSPTRVNRATGVESTPDLTLCGNKWADKFSWSTGESIGSSDHKPIYITISSQVQHQSVFGKQ